MVIVAAITMVVIVYSTIRYTSSQKRDFKDNAHTKDFSTVTLDFIGSDETLELSQFDGQPFLIHFWSTWSGMSIDINLMLQDLSEETGIEIVAATVRDDPGQVMKYLAEYPNDFHVVDGTDLFYELEATGVPSQIFFDKKLSVYLVQIGRDEDKVRETIRSLTGVDQ